MNTEQFFYRNAIFSKRENVISIIDFNKPEENRQDMEPWFGIVYQLADGQHTIEEMYNLLAQKYVGGAPPELLRTLLSIVERMTDVKLIMLTDVKTDLPYYLSMPFELMDMEEAKKTLLLDKVTPN